MLIAQETRSCKFTVNIEMVGLASDMEAGWGAGAFKYYPPPYFLIQTQILKIPDL